MLPMERMLREGVVDARIRPVPVLDGLAPPQWLRWYLEPFTLQPVTSP